MNDDGSAAPGNADQGGLTILKVMADGASPGSQDEYLLRITPAGRIVAYNGHVDLGTGIRTALTQIVAEELDLQLGDVEMVLGNVRTGPNQGATIASTTLQVTAIPLRHAAAQARHWLIAEAATQFQCSVGEIELREGRLYVAADDDRFMTFAELTLGRDVRLMVDLSSATKSPADYKVVGQSTPRVDIPEKVTGAFVYVHDVRMTGMVHGRVVRPPYAGIDTGPFVGKSLLEVDEASVRDIPTLIAVVTLGDFVGVVAEREEDAIRAADRLVTTWKDVPDLPDMSNLEKALRNNPARRRMMLDKGDVDAALAKGKEHTRNSYVWPYQMHGSIGPSCGVADVRPDAVTIWSGTQNPHWLRDDIATLLNRPVQEIDVVRLEAAGCYGRNCADDVCADAALLSRAVGRPVRVQLSREQEHAWEPKGAATLVDIEGALDAAGNIDAYDFQNWYSANRAPTLALLLTGAISSDFEYGESGDRTSVPPYEYPNLRVVVNDAKPIVRASWIRGVAALPNSFAHESFIDEMAYKVGVDPVEYRLRHIKDARAVELIKAVAQRANWRTRTKPGMESDGDILRGQGFAYALYVHSKFPGFSAAWSAWVANVEVRRSTGEVRVTSVIAGQDSGLMINPTGVRHQLNGNVIQSTSRALMEEVHFDKKQVTSREWGAYPIINFVDVPDVNALLLKRDDQPPVGAGESASVPSAAAIANAIFDATGVRFREVPFTPERVKAGLEAAHAPKPKKTWLSVLMGSATTTAVAVAASLAWQSTIAPIARPESGNFSLDMIARGRMLAAIGGCAVCHTDGNGPQLAGGHRLVTPFGTIYSTNITPDPETGIGAWSYEAFDRAMRHGVHQDGRRLYPAFPYTSYAKMTDADMQALYAYLMAQPAVSAPAKPAELAFPFNQRALLAGWNAMYHRPSQYKPDPAQSAEWNRGAYLVEGIGHCSACHSPRGVLGAEKDGPAHLAGGTVAGWEAPALTALSKAPVPWTKEALFAYMRTGFSPEHGAASGPMAPVVAALAEVGDSDIRAMAVYLASLNGNVSAETAAASAKFAESRAPISPAAALSIGGRLFQGACAACHVEPASAQGIGVRPSLALNTNLHSDRPDNLIRIILDGIPSPAYTALGDMPGFRASMDDEHVEKLITYMRSTFAAGQPTWKDLPQAIRRIREESRVH